MQIIHLISKYKLYKNKIPAICKIQTSKLLIQLSTVISYLFYLKIQKELNLLNFFKTVKYIYFYSKFKVNLVAYWLSI